MKFMTKMAADAASRIKQAERDGLLDEIVLGMHDKDPTALAAVLPFGSSYVGYRRGADDDRRLEGVFRGGLGGIAGGIAGGLAGGAPGLLLGNLPLMHLGAGLGVASGNVLGTHLATRGLVDDED